MTYPLDKFKNEIISQLKKILSEYECEIRLEISPEGRGDFAFPCFSLASLVKKSPNDIAESLADKIEKSKWIAKAEANGGYVNFFVDDKYLISSTLRSIFEMKEKYGHLQKKNEKVIIEHTSANPNGPLHVGRARNPIIGDTLVRIFKAAGYDVESQFYLDDMGKQVAILAWGLNNLDSKNVPKSEYDKPDHQNVGFYQAANELMEKDKKVAEEIGEIVKRSEHGESKTIELIHKAYALVLEGINESLHRINIQIDKYIPESTFVRDKSVEQVINKLKKTKYCHEENGAFYLDLESFGIQGRNTKFFFLRKDGTTLYATRDVAYHQWKAKHADLLINVLGEDHKLESKQVEIALKLLGAKISPRVLFYAFVSLPGGKMSTRRARVVCLDELLDECIERAYREVEKRRGSELSEGEMKKIAEMVGIGSLRYNIIKVQPEKDIVFRWEEALNFEGNAVPFIQYAHARACSILSKIKDEKRDFDSNTLKHDSEVKLMKQLARFPLFIEDASSGYKPHIIANYLYETASKFNQFYRDCPVLSEKNTMLGKSRITLVDATRIVLNNALELLGISAPEEM
ncbi:arginyl-tRNA synthetase [Thermoplasmatales archaeon SCGC AB-540-F20]|nr:arginyl-tRNA synthetase [Thermoplasmatales archaeon SCGC AB-540-F20]